jgi:S-disulfanyl-L-cysteine oxidoreductase SoxD
MSPLIRVRSLVLCSIVSGLIVLGTAFMGAQGAPKTVAAGVYTDAQAARGAATYDTSCSGCHQPDLSGGTGPALKEQRFARDFAGKDLAVLYTKILKTMPRGDPGSLSESEALDLVAHVLKENGFPTGQADLTVENSTGVQLVAGKPKPPPPAGDFSYVEVVGCFTAGQQDGGWYLTRASEPVVVTLTTPPSDVKTLGSKTIHLLDAMAYAPETHKGQKMSVRGLLVKLPDEQRMTISSITMVAPTCSE